MPPKLIKCPKLFDKEIENTLSGLNRIDLLPLLRFIPLGLTKMTQSKMMPTPGTR